ncbi:hypothetical protein EC957_008278, partial [Mortierella hygrophila]
LLISDDREIGVFGKLSPDSDTQIAIEHMLQEAQEMELSYRLAKSLSTCETLPDILLEELELQDEMTSSDRELALRIERGEPSAERLLRASTARFPLIQACLMDDEDVTKYQSIKNEIDHPCPPTAELDAAASRVISEKGWKPRDISAAHESIFHFRHTHSPQLRPKGHLQCSNLTLVEISECAMKTCPESPLARVNSYIVGVTSQLVSLNP